MEPTVSELFDLLEPRLIHRIRDSGDGITGGTFRDTELWSHGGVGFEIRQTIGDGTENPVERSSVTLTPAEASEFLLAIEQGG